MSQPSATIHIESGSKMDADRLLASVAGIRTQEVNSRYGWNYTKIFFHTQRIGFLMRNRTNAPLHIHINLHEAVEAGADLNQLFAELTKELTA
jgi:hypothetical protein